MHNITDYYGPIFSDGDAICTQQYIHTLSNHSRVTWSEPLTCINQSSQQPDIGHSDFFEIHYHITTQL